MDDADARAVVERFGRMRQDLEAAAARLHDLAADEGEHDLVVRALEPMDGGRKCFRLVGGWGAGSDGGDGGVGGWQGGRGGRGWGACLSARRPSRRRRGRGGAPARLDAPRPPAPSLRWGMSWWSAR